MSRRESTTSAALPCERGSHIPCYADCNRTDREDLRHKQQWVFVNAWSIYDRRSESPFGDYTENFPVFPTPPASIHPSHRPAGRKNFDIIFCAGNCGGVCPDGRCGPNDFGPGRGIWGANAHPSVLTVGAVRTDTNWIGYCSEGPGPGRPPSTSWLIRSPIFARRAITSSPAVTSHRTAARRRRRPLPRVWLPPSEAGTSGHRPRYHLRILINVLNATAQKINGPLWNRRTGNGILDLCGAVAALP